MSAKRLVMAMVLVMTGGIGTAQASDPAYVTIGAGSWETFRSDAHAAEFDLSYRFGEKFWIFKPHIGILSATDGDYLGYAGILSDLPVGKHLVLTFSTAIGGYAGNGFHLGSTIEFRSGGEVAWRFANQSKLGLGFYHISNAGLTSRNPGEESALLVYSFPLDSLTGR